MAGETGKRLSKLLPLLDQVSDAEMRGSLPPLVSAGAISFYVRVPGGKAAYMDTIQRLQTCFSHASDALSQSLSPHSLSLVRDAKRRGTPVIEHPTLIRDAIYLGLSARDAELLLAVERVDVHWFHSAVQLMPSSAEGTRRLIQVVPRRSPCCVRPDDGQPKRGPWIGHDADHFLSITLGDVLVEASELEILRKAEKDPFEVKEASPGVYVLYRGAVHFNLPGEGVKASQDEVKSWLKAEAEACGVDDWLFNKTVLRQVKKLINTAHSESRGVKQPTHLNTKALDDNEAAALAEHHWVSERLILTVHAARLWRQIVKEAGRPWDTLPPERQMMMARRFGPVLESLGFANEGEREALLSIIIYPFDLRDTRRQLKISQQRHA
jgi:hypothetical protein